MKRIDILFSIFFLMVVFVNCSDKKKQDDGDNKKSELNLSSTESSQNQEPQKEEHSAPLVIIGESKDALKPYYELEHIREFYELELEMKREEIPTLQVPENLSELSYGDLRLLRNEIFARNGYLFNDGFLRGYFNKFNWYMPIFDVDTFKIVMSAYEQELVNRIIEEESRRKLDNFTEIGDLRLYNADLVVNEKQFKQVSPIVIQDLKKQNFSIVSAGRQMPFYIYDKNAYQYVPHYITTDLYLFILHKYFSRFLEKLDENHLSKLLELVLSGVVKELNDKPLYKDNDARSWVEMYAKTALFALTEVSQKVPPQFEPIYSMEKENIVSERGNPLFIKNKEVNYEELKPRGHYTKSEILKKYFKSFKWISLNGIDLDNNEEFRGFLLLGYVLKTEPELYRKYAEFTSIIQKISGVEDNISIKDVISAIEDLSLEQLFQKENLSNIKNELASLNKERVKRVFGSDFPTPEKGKTRIYFLSSTYSISGEIFSRLVHINWEKSKRPFPRGLDIPAVFRNQTAQNIILDEYKDDERWPDYLDSLTFLQLQFDDYEGWDSNYAAKGLKTALSSLSEESRYPDFLKTDAYNRKELSTMLSSWTHIKHDLILYQEKPFAAEAGQGGGPEPPKYYAYVEPNLNFWKEALSLTDWLMQLTMYESTFKGELQRITDIGYEIRNVVDKQLSGVSPSEDDLQGLKYIGGRIEYILLGLLETDHLPEREKSMALIADVYSYNGENLNVAVGHADDIYVIVPINGEYHIARGAVFSYYEFTDNMIYNDEEWRTKIYNNDVPQRPEWLKPLIHNVEPLEGQMEYRYPGHWMRDY